MFIAYSLRFFPARFPSAKAALAWHSEPRSYFNYAEFLKPHLARLSLGPSTGSAAAFASFLFWLGYGYGFSFVCFWVGKTGLRFILSPKFVEQNF